MNFFNTKWNASSYNNKQSMLYTLNKGIDVLLLLTALAVMYKFAILHYNNSSRLLQRQCEDYLVFFEVSNYTYVIK